MKGKVVLQIAFLAVLIYVFAAIAGAAPGASVRGPGFAARIGKRKRHHGRRGRRRRARPYRWVTSGMGAELIATPGTSTPIPAGWQQVL